MVGRWRAPFAMQITNPAALRASPVGWFDRLSLAVGVPLTRWVGPALLQTSVVIEPDGVVLHTTRVSKLGIPLFVSTERFDLDPNGRDGRLRGHQRTAPWFRAVPQTGSVTVDADAKGAVYDVGFAGDRVKQVTRVDGPDALILTQTTAWWWAEARLQRYGGP